MHVQYMYMYVRVVSVYIHVHGRVCMYTPDVAVVARQWSKLQLMPVGPVATDLLCSWLQGQDLGTADTPSVWLNMYVLLSFRSNNGQCVL